MWTEKILRSPGDHPDRPKTLILAPTGVAANLIGNISLPILFDTFQLILYVFIGGTTFHTGLGFKKGEKYYSLRREKLDQLRNELDQDLALLICDEMSMIGADFLYGTHQRMVEIMVCDDFFGGMAILLVGDIMQLKPIQKRAIFAIPPIPKHLALFNSPENLWNNFTVVVPDVNIRQGGINSWTKCLNNVRTITNGHLLSDEDINLLMSRKMSNFPNSNEIANQALHLYFKNVDVDAYNYKKLEEIISPLETMEAELPSPEYYTPDIKKHGTIDDTAFKKTLHLKVGAKVMLIHNINLLDSLVNGQIGEVIDFLYESKYQSFKLYKLSFQKERLSSLISTTGNQSMTNLAKGEDNADEIIGEVVDFVYESK